MIGAGGIEEVLFQIADALRVPVLIAALLALLLTLFDLGAFFVEAVFLGLWMFGWGRLPKRLHLACVWIVAGAAVLSAYTILVANSWMQHPVGYKLVDGHAQLTNVLPVLFNVNVGLTTLHVLSGALLTGSVIVLAVAAWHLLRRRDDKVDRAQERRSPRRVVTARGPRLGR